MGAVKYCRSRHASKIGGPEDGGRGTPGQGARTYRGATRRTIAFNVFKYTDDPVVFDIFFESLRDFL